MTAQNERGSQLRRPRIKTTNQLFLAVLFHVSLRGFVGMMPGVQCVCSCGVRMMGCFFVLSALVVLGCFGVVMGRMRMVLC